MVPVSLAAGFWSSGVTVVDTVIVCTIGIVTVWRSVSVTVTVDWEGNTAAVVWYWVPRSLIDGVFASEHLGVFFTMADGLLT
jgi:hypothetical protein